MKTALITGVAGQDGILLSRLLVGLGYRVIGTVPEMSQAHPVMDIYSPATEVIELDSRDRVGLRKLLEDEAPAEVYNLASFSSVGQSWNQPWLVTEVNGLAVLGLLEEVLALRRSSGYDPRILQASSSEMFGLVRELPQSERSAHHPRSPYATAKSFAHHTAVNYRESYGIYVTNTILFNHESPLRPATFVTRKITTAVAAIAAGDQDQVTLGRIDVRRDWGAACDYVAAMHAALQPAEAGDYCIATGVSHSLADFIDAAFRAVGISDGLDRVVSDPALMRPADVPETRGDPSRAREALGWAPQTSFEQIVASMVKADRARLATGVEHDPEYLR